MAKSKNKKKLNGDNIIKDFSIRTGKEKIKSLYVQFPVMTDLRQTEILKILKDIPDEEPKEDLEMNEDFSKFIKEIEEKKEKNKLKKENSLNKSVYLNKSDIIDEMEILSTPKKEKLIWIFQTIKKAKEENTLMSSDPVYVEFGEIIIKPYFILKTFEWDFLELFKHIKEDKDFFRKHKMIDYNPRFEIDPFNDDDNIIMFSDFTDDFIKAYLEDRLGIKTENEVTSNDGSNVVLQKTKKKQLKLPDLPSDLKWEEITIRFLNGEEVQIKIKELVYQTSHELMGFQNEKSKKPNLQWDLLKILALKNGYLNWDNNNDLDTKTRNRAKKQKQELSERLRVYFHTVKEDPFFDYREEDGYKIKIKLISEQGSDITDTIGTTSNTVDYYNEDNDVNMDDYLRE